MVLIITAAERRLKRYIHLYGIMYNIFIKSVYLLWLQFLYPDMFIILTGASGPTA